MSRQVRHIERLALDAHALAFPSRVKAAIAKIGNIGEAADGLAQADVVATYAKRIKATTEEVNSVQYGKLLLAAKVGDLCPAEKGGRGKVRSATGGFHEDTLTDYRKLARHQADGRIDDYWEAVTEADHEAEMSIAGFLNFVGSGGVIATRHGGGVIEWYTPKEDIEWVRKVLGTIELEQDADVVLFLSKHEPTDAEPHNAILTVAKNRNGETGPLRLEWDGPTTRFSCPSGNSYRT